MTWDLVDEVEFDTDGTKASLSWRGDGAAVAAVVRDASGAVQGFVVDRKVRKHVKLDMSALVQSGSYVSWQPRLGGAISLAGPRNVVTFFERNGLHHSRHDFELLAADGHPAIRILGAPSDIISWSCDSCMLAVVTSHGESPIAPSESVDVYVRSNYKWDHQCSLTVHSAVTAMQWDAEHPRLLTVEVGSLSARKPFFRHAIWPLCPHFACNAASGTVFLWEVLIGSPVRSLIFVQDGCGIR